MSQPLDIIYKSAAEWAADSTTVLSIYQEGVERDTGKAKRGNGSSLFSAMQYHNPTGVASAASITAEINAAVAALVDGAPGALNTLNELAAALGDDAAFATTVTNALATVQNGVDSKVNKALNDYDAETVFNGDTLFYIWNTGDVAPKKVNFADLKAAILLP